MKQAKKQFLLIIFLIAPVCCFSQFTDKFWLVGRHVSLDFTSPSPTINPIDSNFSALTPGTSICDRNGNLLFYADAGRVYNKKRKVMPNGSNFNHGTFSDNYINSNNYPANKPIVIIPFPNDSTKFYVFYENMEWYVKGSISPEKLMYLIVDMKLNNGLGDVVSKEQVVISNDTLANGEVLAIKHGNGTDWWIVCRKFQRAVYYSILINKNGVNKPIINYFNSDYIQNNPIGGICNSSLNGDKLMFNYQSFQSTPNPLNGQLDIFHFDRCSGKLDSSISISLPYDSCQWLSYCFSPNGRFLYANDGNMLWQLDLSNSNILGSKILIANNQSTVPQWMMKIGPDNKIYMCSYGSSDYLHIIEKPDSLGLKCNFLEDTLYCHGGGNWADGSLPNNANYQLKALPNCIDGVEDILKSEKHLLIYPNPCAEIINFKYANSKTIKIEILDITGKILVRKLSSSTEYHNLNVSVLAKGIYFIKIVDSNSNSTISKFIKE